MAINLGVAFGEGADCGQVVFLELVGQEAEPPAEHHHASGGECDVSGVARSGRVEPGRERAALWILVETGRPREIRPKGEIGSA